MTRDRLGLLCARDLIEKMAKQFRLYSDEHAEKMQKLISDGDAEKAAAASIKSGVNGNLAIECEKFLDASDYVLTEGSEV